MEYIVPETEHGVVYRNVKDTIFKYNGWPTVCRDDRGVLYVTASSMRLTHGDPTGKNCMWVSFNEGKTWTKPIVVNDSKFDDRDTGICSLGGGKMVMSWFTETAEDFYDGMQDYTWYDPEDKAITLGYGNMLKQLPKEEIKQGIAAFVKTSDAFPSRTRMTRSAMAVKAELCVISTMVLPDSRQVVCSSDRICLPVL